MKNSNEHDDQQSTQTQINDGFKKLMGFGTDQYEKIDEGTEDTRTLANLKDNLRSQETGADDDLATDIQDAIGRDPSLSLVNDYILVTADNEIVTLTGEVYTGQEKMIAGDIATILAGDDNVVNHLKVIHQDN